MRPFLAMAYGLLLIVAGAMLGSPPDAAVATAHRLAQARTDAQPVLKDDLAGQKRTNGGESAGNLPAVPDSSVDLGKVLADHLEASTREILVREMPLEDGFCGYCVQLHREWGNGWPGVRVRYVSGGAVHGYPQVELPDCPTFVDPVDGQAKPLYWNYVPRATMQQTLKMYPPQAPKIPQAVSIGKLQMGQTVAAILDRVSTDRGASVISLGAASVYLPAAMPVTVQLSPQAATLTFSGAKPRARYSLLGADINAITVSRDRCTVSLAGMPDLTMEVVP